MIDALRTPFQGIVDRHARFTAELRALPPAQLDFQPAPGAWSLGEVAQHLALVEEKTTRVLTERRVAGVSRRALLDVIYRAPALDLYFLVGGRARMPVRGVAPDPAATLDDTLARWAAARERLRDYLEAVDDGAGSAIVYRHPVAGYMDIFATLRFLTQHHDHHMRQTARIRAARGFPA